MSWEARWLGAFTFSPPCHISFFSSDSHKPPLFPLLGQHIWLPEKLFYLMVYWKREFYKSNRFIFFDQYLSVNMKKGWFLFNVNCKTFLLQILIFIKNVLFSRVLKMTHHNIHLILKGTLLWKCEMLRENCWNPTFFVIKSVTQSH